MATICWEYTVQFTIGLDELHPRKQLFTKFTTLSYSNRKADTNHRKDDNKTSDRKRRIMAIVNTCCSLCSEYSIVQLLQGLLQQTKDSF